MTKKQSDRRYYLKNKTKIRAQSKAWYFKNKTKADNYTKQWHKENHKRSKEIKANNKLKTKYGITLNDYNKLFEKQQGLCAICKQPPYRLGKRGIVKLSVDHNHQTTKVRGLLCFKCNSGIGLLTENPLFLLRAVEYLQANG